MLLLLFGLLLQTATQCSSGKKSASFDTPEATFQAMVTAIKAKDLESYKLCWYTERAEKEGLVHRFEQDPELWDELAALFIGKVTLKPDGGYSDDKGTFKKFIVDAPDVPKGKGIGSISMIQVGDSWKMYHW